MLKVSDYLTLRDVRDAIGFERHTRSNLALYSLAGFGVGMLVGAGVALYLSPSRANALRDRVNEHLPKHQHLSPEVEEPIAEEAMAAH